MADHLQGTPVIILTYIGKDCLLFNKTSSLVHGSDVRKVSQVIELLWKQELSINNSPYSN